MENPALQKTLLLGYGNPDRQDDGIAWHILAAVAEHFHYPVPASWEEGFEPSALHPNLELLFTLQLTPEMADIIPMYKKIIFVDAHTGRVPEDVHLEEINPVFQGSPFTHHLTPATLCYLSNSLYGVMPEAILVSARGFEFGFSHSLSNFAANLLNTAVSTILTQIPD